MKDTGGPAFPQIERNPLTILDLNAPDFVERLKEAIGLKPGEKPEIMTPQFTRTDGLTVPVPIIDFTKLSTLSEETLKAIGCQKWDEPNAAGDVLWLFPYEWYDHIPNGLEIVDINFEKETFEGGKTDNDTRFGALAFGFMRNVAPPHHPIGD